MNISHMTDEALFSMVKKLSKDMTASSSPRSAAIEKERIMYINELFKRGKIGYPPKKKYRVS